MSMPDRLPPGPLYDQLAAFVDAEVQKEEAARERQLALQARQEVLDKTYREWQKQVQAPARQVWNRATDLLGALPFKRVGGNTSGINVDWWLENTKEVAGKPLAMAITVHAMVNHESPQAPPGLLYAVMLAGDNHDRNIPKEVPVPQDSLLGVLPNVRFGGRRDYSVEALRAELPRYLAGSISHMNLHVHSQKKDWGIDDAEAKKYGVSVGNGILHDSFRPHLTVPECADPVYNEFLRTNSARTEADMTPEVFLDIATRHADQWKDAGWNMAPFVALGQVCFALQGAEPASQKSPTAG